ncbi:MAG: cyclic nucleotide-binding domain-containing protein [Aureliella sp.]
MSEASIEVQRPDRWDHPLADDMTKERVDWLLRQPPFCDMNVERFARSTPLADILRNDARVLNLRKGDVVFREGQYGGTAYLVLDGVIRISLSKLLAKQKKGRRSRSKNQWLGFLRRRKYKNDDRRDSRRGPRSQTSASESGGKQPQIAYRGTGSETRIFLQDVPGVLDEHATAAIEPGEMFGEMAAVTRTPRDFTAFAEKDCAVLEIRWQGLKLLKQDPAFRNLLDERYRGEVLKNHLRETNLFRFVPEENLDHIVESTKLESFGSLEWYAEYRKRSNQSPSKRIEAEPLIAEEGSYATGLWIVRGGFARLSRRQGAGHRTLSYLGKGQIYGLSELVHNFTQAGKSPPLPYQESLRAIGYVDALCVPKQVVIEHVLPFVRRGDLPSPIESPRYQFGQPIVDAPLVDSEHNVETGLLEFLVEQRLMNGHKTMVIDTERCTRCDDCVRACASTHGGTPVFAREGPQYGPWMFAHACMHCEDPVCMIGCPTGAIHRDHDSGLVEINEQTCIGCSGCAQSCPYDNIRMVTASDNRGRAKVDQNTGLPILQASKCDLCSSAGGRPSCQAACPHDALVRLDMSDLQTMGDWMQRRTG